MKISTKSLTFTALLAAIICVLSPIAINIGPIPLSFGTLAIYIASSLIDMKHGVAAVVVFVALGAVGVPVFTNWTGGFGRIAGPTGGYIIGYISMAFIIGLIVDRLNKHIWAYPVAMTVGTAVLYLFGTAWFMIQSGADLASALLACVVPFLIGDALKIVASTLLCFRLRRLVYKLILTDRREKKSVETDSDAHSLTDDVSSSGDIRDCLESDEADGEK